MAKKASCDPLVQWMLEPDGRWTPTDEKLDLEIEERKLARQLLRRRDRILKAVYLFTEGFLRTPLNGSSIKPILQKLGHAAELSRVYIFKNHTAKDGTLLTSQRYEWTAPDIDTQQANPELQESPWIEGGFERWVKAFRQGELIYGFVNEFPQKEQEVLAKQGIISIMAAPIFVGTTWWGFIGFDECLTEREWSPIETEALKTAANIIGAAIQRRKAEKALVDSEKKYRLVVENATEGIVIAQDKMLKFVNSQTKRFTGYSDKELAARSFLDFVHPDDREMVIQHHIKRISGEETPRTYAFRMLDKDGNTKWLENNGVIIEWEGHPATLNFFSDITKRKQAENDMRESEEKYRQLFENESDAVMVFDADTHLFEDANQATLDLLGYTREEFNGMKVDDISAEKEKTRTAVDKVIKDDPEGIRVPLRYFVRKDGTTFPGEIFAGSFISNNRKKIIGTVRDISNRIEAEEKIRALNQQLIKAQENERHRISRYLHDHVAQDLSTLKIGIETLYDNRQAESDKIKNKILELTRLLQGSIAAVRNLSYDLRPPAMDHLGLARTIFEYAKDFSERHDVQIDFYSAGMEDLKLDFDTEINLFRIVQEGLNNIGKHAHATDIIIRLVASSPNIILRIEDNGRGFIVDEQLNRALKDKHMGLSSMEERVNLLGGTIKIRSRPSEGTRISIEVPIRENKIGRKKKHIDH